MNSLLYNIIGISTLILIQCYLTNGYYFKKLCSPVRFQNLHLNNVLTDIPNTEKSRLSLICVGKSIDSALFRAELKKELTFFRGCSGIYNLNPNTKILEIVGEGKTKQLSRFLEWMNSLTTELVTRKPNFQGPSIIIKIEKVKWTEYEGTLKGFLATEEAPQLSENSQDPSKIEAKSMTGTDESV